MARLETWYKQDLKRPLFVHKHTDVFNQDSNGNLIGVEVYSDGEPVVLSGSINGYCLLANGTTVPAVGASRSGNKASVLIPQTAYSVPGPITITIKNVEGDNITTLCATVGIVRQSVSGNLVNPGSVVTDWSNNINAQLQAVQTAADNVGAIVAAPFDENTVYVVGNYVTNNGNLYRITADHAAGVAWVDTAKVQCTVGSELSELKSAFDEVAGVSYSRNLYNPAELKTGINILPTGAETPNAGYSCTDFLPIDGVVCISATIGYDIGAAGGRVLLYDSTKTLIPDGSHDVSQNSYTSDSALQRNYWVFTGTDAKYVRLRGLNAMWADGYKIQIEASSTHTAYVAYTPPTFAIKDGTITSAMFAEDAVQDALNYYGTVETITGSYYKTYTKDFVQGKSYLITLVNKTDSAPIVFYGVIEGTNRASVFTLDGGQSYLFTPTRNFIGLYWGSNGSYTITINNMDGFEEKLPHIFYCGENREYKTLKSAIEAATLYMDSILYVDAGVYDIIQEFGDAYFAGLTSISTSLGIRLKNRIHIIFSPNSKVVCHYTGDNQYACSVFSPFHVFEYGFTIENLNLECSRVRYAFHDERNGGIEQCQSIFKNCRMVIDNSQNEYWTSKTCIGGGLGSNHEVRITDCIFDTTDSGLNAGVYYHQSNNTSISNHKANITVKDCYFVNGTVILQMSRTDATDDTNIIITNNNFPNIAQADSEGVYLNGMTASHVNVFVWNNKKRTA